MLSRMIRSFGDKDTEKLFSRNFVRGLPGDIQNRAYNKLRQIDFAGALSDLSIPPSNRLEALSGPLRGFFSIRVNAQWRIIFRFRDGNALDVKLCDYH